MNNREGRPSENHKIFVGNLPWKTTADQLREMFAAYGKVLSANIVSDKETGKSKGFGFVEMEDETSANNAIEGLNGKPMQDRNLRVSKAQERDRSERGDRGDRGDRGGDRGGRGERSSYNSGGGYRSGQKSPF